MTRVDVYPAKPGLIGAVSELRTLVSNLVGLPSPDVAHSVPVTGLGFRGWSIADQPLAALTKTMVVEVSAKRSEVVDLIWVARVWAHWPGLPCRVALMRRGSETVIAASDTEVGEEPAWIEVPLQAPRDLPFGRSELVVVVSGPTAVAQSGISIVRTSKRLPRRRAVPVVVE